MSGLAMVADIGTHLACCIVFCTLFVCVAACFIAATVKGRR